MRESETSSVRINRWLSLARWAPSGGNYQPWQATGQETDSEVCILLRIRAEYLQTSISLDQHHWLGVFSLGSITYNLKLCAEADGFSAPEIKLKTDADPAACLVELIFKKVASEKAIDLEKIFKSRKTDRSLYSQEDIPAADLEQLGQIFKQPLLGNQSLLAKSWSLRRGDLIAPLLPLEEIRWKNRSIYTQTLDEITFKNNTNSGIPASTLQANLGKLAFIWILKLLPPIQFLVSWSRKFIAYENFTKPLQESNRIFMLQANENNPEAWFNLGLVYQESWLYLSQQGISFQPISMTLIGYNHFFAPSESILSDTEVSKVEAAAVQLQKNLGLDLSKPLLGFRIGYSRQAVDLSPRREFAVETPATKPLKAA